MMKFKVLFLFFFASLTITFAHDIPKACYGSYGGEMPGYAIELNGEMLDIAAHDVYITITENKVIYKSENLKMDGEYVVIKQSKNEYVFKASLSNGKTVEWEIEFILNKKEKEIRITPKNGQSEATLERLDD